MDDSGNRFPFTRCVMYQVVLVVVVVVVVVVVLAKDMVTNWWKMRQARGVYGCHVKSMSCMSC